MTDWSEQSLSPQQARQKRGWSLYMAAKRSGVAETTIRRLEQQGIAYARKMTVMNILRLWEVYFPDCTLRDFVGGRCPAEIVPLSPRREREIRAEAERLASLPKEGVDFDHTEGGGEALREDRDDRSTDVSTGVPGRPTCGDL